MNTTKPLENMEAKPGFYAETGWRSKDSFRLIMKRRSEFIKKNIELTNRELLERMVESGIYHKIQLKNEQAYAETLASISGYRRSIYGWHIVDTGNVDRQTALQIVDWVKTTRPVENICALSKPEIDNLISIFSQTGKVVFLS